MKKRHIAVNILTAIPAFILSILLVVCLTASAIYGVALSSITPKAISDVVQGTVAELVNHPDFENIILKNETVQANIEELGITTEAVGELMQSEAVTEVVDLLAADFANALSGSDEVQLTPEALLSIVEKHADDLADIAVEMTDEPLVVEEIKQQIIATVERDADKLTDVLPDPQTIRESMEQDDTVSRVMALLRPTYLWIAYGVCLTLALLIYACRCYRFGGFLWLGVDTALAGGAVATSVYGIRTFGLDILSDAFRGAESILTPLVDRVAKSMQWRMWIYFGVAVLLITGFILLKTLVVKKKLAAAPTPVMPQPVPSQAPAATEPLTTEPPMYK